MKTLKRILAATTLLVTLGFASEANAQVPLENFFKNPEKAGYQISPDGKYEAGENKIPAYKQIHETESSRKERN